MGSARGGRLGALPATSLTLLCPRSYKGLVAEALRQLVGEECYRQDEVLPPGYCTGSRGGGCPLGLGGLWVQQKPCGCLGAGGRPEGGGLFREELDSAALSPPSP